MTPGEKVYLIRWSFPLALGFGLLIWSFVLLWLERREKSKRSNSRVR